MAPDIGRHPFSFARRRVLVTGGGSGIGRAFAIQLAERGTQVMVVGRREQPLRDTASHVQERGGTAHVVSADLIDPAQADRVVEAAVSAMGGLDVVINNAGNVSAGRLEDTSVDDITAMVALNLVAPILVTRAALPALRAAGSDIGGLIVGVSSGIALVGQPFYTTYAAVKAGLARFDEALRRELLGTGINVATIYPGATDTPMMDTNTGGPELGFERRRVDDVVAQAIAALEAGEVEVNTVAEGSDRAAMQKLNAEDPLAVDAALEPKLGQLYDATRTHRSI